MTVTFDGIPNVVISSALSDPTETSPIPVTFTFTEDVTDFNASDLVIGNGTSSGFTEISARIFSALITPIADGIVTVDINANSAFDSTSNGNVAAPQFSITFDSIPRVLISSEVSGSTNNPSIPVSFSFTEAITGFDSSDVVVSNGAVSDFSSINANIYTATVSAASEGDVTVYVPAGAVTDSTLNTNTVSNQFKVVYDITSADLVISSTESTPSNASSLPITITFNESVTDFEATDVRVLNGTLTNFPSRKCQSLSR